MSPHLTIWKWGPHMLVSILHRITGAGLAVVGLGILVNAYKLARARGGDIKFAAAVPEVRRLFQITRTDKYLEFHDGLDAARQAFDGA